MRRKPDPPKPDCVPTLDLTQLHNYEQKNTPLPIELRISQHKIVLQSLQDELLSPNVDPKTCALDAMISAKHAICLMQGITGNEADSHAERIRKERIPLSQRNEIQRATKTFAAFYTELAEAYKTLLENIEDKAERDIHNAYLLKFMEFLSECDNTLDEMFGCLQSSDTMHRDRYKIPQQNSVDNSCTYL